MIVAIGNEKGGVLKTTVVLHLADYIVKKKNESVLIVDLDTQGGIKSFFQNEENKRTDFNVFAKTADILDDNWEPTEDRLDGLWITEGSALLSDYDGHSIQNLLISMRKLRKVKVDHIIIDLPPTSGYKILAAVSVCDGVFIPNDFSRESQEGVHNFLTKVVSMQKAPIFKTTVRPLGIIPTKIDNRSVYQKENVQKSINQFGEKFILKSIISERPSCKRSLSECQLVWESPKNLNREATAEFIAVCESVYRRMIEAKESI